MLIRYLGSLALVPSLRQFAVRAQICARMANRVRSGTGGLAPGLNGAWVVGWGTQVPYFQSQMVGVRGPPRTRTFVLALFQIRSMGNRSQIYIGSCLIEGFVVKLRGGLFIFLF